jgi:hypothetical protein
MATAPVPVVPGLKASLGQVSSYSAPNYYVGWYQSFERRGGVVGLNTPATSVRPLGSLAVQHLYRIMTWNPGGGGGD